MKRGDVFSVDGTTYTATKEISSVKTSRITKEDAQLFFNAGFIVKKQPVYRDYLIKIYENDYLVKAYTVSENEEKIDDYVTKLHKEYNQRNFSTPHFTLSYEKIYTKQ